VEWFLTGGTERRILLVADGTEQSSVAVSERSVDQVSFALGTHEALLMPMLVLETDVLYT